MFCPVMRKMDRDGRRFDHVRSRVGCLVLNLPDLHVLLCGLAWFLLGSQPLLRAEEQTSSADTFRQTIAPVLEKKCISCHYPGNLKGGLNLSTRSDMLSGGDSGASLVVGEAHESPLYSRAIPQEGLPPEMPEKGEPLSEQQAEALRQWIVAGAPWPEDLVLRERSQADRSFWSFQPLAQGTPPELDDFAPKHWRQHPVDRFVFAKLAAAGLTPNPPANPRTLIRRATYDLTGLPPTPEEVQAFEQACAQDAQAAYAALLDRLLASPQYHPKRDHVLRWSHSNRDRSRTNPASHSRSMDQA